MFTLLNKPDRHGHLLGGGEHEPELAELLGLLHRSAAGPFESATPIPGALNHSTAFLAHEQEKLFRQEWICVGRADELAEVGDFLTLEISEVPVLVVRKSESSIRAFVNVCAHRQAKLVGASNGCSKRFTCPYHAWTYNLAGQLVRAPYMDMKKGFNESEHGLKTLYTEVWAGFIYVSLAAKKPKAVSHRLHNFESEVVGRFDMSCYRTILREQMVWNANWKNLIENYTESYHVPMAHKQTFAQHGKPLSDYVCGEDSEYYAYHRAPQESDEGAGAAHTNNHRLSGEWRRMMIDFCVFPCHLVTLMPDYLWYISVLPQGTDKMLATWGVAVAPENLADISAEQYDQWVTDFRTYIDIANAEDKVLVEALHQGTRSPLKPTGTYHPLEKNLYQFVRYLAKRMSDQ